jgi:hypothetical protein
MAHWHTARKRTIEPTEWTGISSIAPADARLTVGVSEQLRAGQGSGNEGVTRNH